MDKKILTILRIISQKLKHQKIKWVLVGSASLALQGVKIKPSDVDILTNKEGALKINKLLKKYEVTPVKFGSSEFFESYFGIFKIKSIKVDLMGDLKEKVGGEWISLSKRLVSPKIIKIKGMKIPVSSLQDHLKSYRKSNREKDFTRVQKIKETLNEKVRN